MSKNDNDIMIDRHCGSKLYNFQTVSQGKLRKFNVGCIENLIRLIIPREHTGCYASLRNKFNHQILVLIQTT
jgi:hypothetical protein